MMSKPDKDIMKKIHGPSLLMNTDAKILNKDSVENEFRHFKDNTMINLGLSQGCKDSSIYTKFGNVIHHINKLKDKKHMITSIDA